MRFFEKLRAIFNYKGRRAEMELKSAEIRGDKIFLHPVNDPDHTFCVSGKAIDILIDPSVALTEDDFRVIENEKLTKLQENMAVDPTAPIEKLLHQNDPKEAPQSPKSKEPPTENDPPKPATEANPKEKLDAKSEPKSRKAKEPKQPAAAAEKQDQSRQTPGKPERIQPPAGPKMHVVSMRLYPEEYEFLMAAIEEKGYKKTEYLLACVAAAKKKSMESNYQKYYAERLRRQKERREAARRAQAENEKTKTAEESEDEQEGKQNLAG